MASLKLSLSLSTFHRHLNTHTHFTTNNPILFSFVPLFPNTHFSSNTLHHAALPSSNNSSASSFLVSYRFSPSEDDEGDEAESRGFDEAVELFNRREYYKCHDFLEALWNGAEEPARTLIHGILQCAVGFHHLFNQNHKGAMMELGEGLCKLRKMDFRSGPFHQFERDISQVLDFIYQTQIELAACGDDLCVAMDRSERSYQLLGGYAAGQHLYELQIDPDDQAVHIVFCPRNSYTNGDPPRVKLPTLNATTELLEAFECY